MHALLVQAAITVLLIPYSVDEVFATVQYLWQSRRIGCHSTGFGNPVDLVGRTGASRSPQSFSGRWNTVLALVSQGWRLSSGWRRRIVVPNPAEGETGRPMQDPTMSMRIISSDQRTAGQMEL